MSDYEKALSLRFDSDAGDDLTVRGYLRELLATLWSEGESFSGKRPFGNSGWEYDLYKPLGKAGMIDLGPVVYEDDSFPWAPTREQEVKAAAYVSDLILYALREPTKEA